MSDTIKSIAIATDSLGNYETKAIGADAINIEVSYDEDGVVIIDPTETVATKNSVADFANQVQAEVNTINKTLTTTSNACDTNTKNILTKAPIDHASADTTYGIATSEKYGHVGLIDDISYIGMGIDVAENCGAGISARGIQNLVKELKPLLPYSSSGSGLSRVPEVVLKPDIDDYMYSFNFVSQLSEANAPDTIKLILDCGVEALPTIPLLNTTYGVLLITSFANLGSGSGYYSYTLTEADKAYGYKYLESSTTTTTTDDSGNSTETTTQTYTYRIDALLHKHVDVTSGEYSWSVEVVPNEKYLNNKCDEISAALDVANIPSDLGTTAGSAINALNTHLTDNEDLKTGDKSIVGAINLLLSYVKSAHANENNVSAYWYSFPDGRKLFFIHTEISVNTTLTQEGYCYFLGKNISLPSAVQQAIGEDPIWVMSSNVVFNSGYNAQYVLSTVSATIFYGYIFFDLKTINSSGSINIMFYV